MNDEPPAPRKFTFKAKDFASDNVASTPPAPSVHAILRQNLTVQQSAEPPVLPHLHDRRTKRQRDYWVLMLSGNTLGGLATVILYGNIVALVYLLAFFVIFNLGLVWIMFQVMDKY